MESRRFRQDDTDYSIDRSRRFFFSTIQWLENEDTQKCEDRVLSLSPLSLTAFIRCLDPEKSRACDPKKVKEAKDRVFELAHGLFQMEVDRDNANWMQLRYARCL